MSKETNERKLVRALCHNPEHGIWFDGYDFEVLRRDKGDQLTCVDLDRLSTKMVKQALKRAKLKLVPL